MDVSQPTRWRTAGKEVLRMSSFSRVRGLPDTLVLSAMRIAALVGQSEGRPQSDGASELRLPNGIGPYLPNYLWLKIEVRTNTVEQGPLTP